MLRISCLFLFFFITSSLGAATLPDINVVGVKGKLLTNVKNRLSEMAENKPSSQIANDELVAQTAKALQPYGYFKPHIFIQQGNGVRTLVINPGNPIRIGQLTMRIVGEGKNNPVITAALEESVLKKGDAFNSIRYEKTKQALLTAAENQGYLKATFDQSEVLIDENKYSVTINLTFNTGIQFFFGQVRFDPTYIDPELLRRYIPFKYGQPYSTDQVLAFNNSLSASGYFKSVNVKPEESSNAVIPMQVSLQPAARVNYSLGLGYGTDTGIRGRAGLHIVPVNPAGHKFNAVALGSFKENALQTQYIIPGTNPLVDQFEIVGNLANLNYSAGRGNSALGSLVQRHTTPHFQRLLSINSLYEQFNYTNQPKEKKYSLYPKASFTWLSNADELFVPNGYKVAVSGLGASRQLLSDNNYSQALVDAKVAITLKPISTRLYFHTIQGAISIDDINQFPLTLAFLLGGSDDLKAYEYNSIGPGKLLTYGGLEIQKETKENWYLLGFMDAGDVFKPTPRNLKKDLGIGLMWISPVGPIKLGVAQAVDSNFQRVHGRKPKLVISMGPDL